MTVGHYENFPVASLAMPARLRPAVVAIYRFARAADDLADEGDATPAERLARLAAFRAQLQAIGDGAEPAEAPFAELARAVRAYRLPLAPFEQLLDAFSQDVVKNRYASFDELLDYCRRSANPVGRLLLCLFGRTEARLAELSDRICTGLQLVNFWQDVARDWSKGRLYLPAEDMQRYGVDETHLAEGRCDARWRALLAFQCERARALLLAGAPLARVLSGRLALEIGLTVQGGLRVLERIAAVGYDVFRRRPVLGWRDWPILLWRAR